MSKRSFTLEITECNECPYWEHFSGTCDCEGDQMEVKLSSDGGLPTNCPIWLENQVGVDLDIDIDNAQYPNTPEESFRPKGGGNLRWQK